MKDFLLRRPLFIGFVLSGLAWVAFSWLSSDFTDDTRIAPARHANPPVTAKSINPRHIGAPRSLQGLTVDNQRDISADGRPPDARRDSIVRTGIGEIQEMQQMNKPIFDAAAKRWNAQPRVKEIIAQWQATEAAWKTQDDEAKAAVVPQMEAMWKEALGLLREEVEKSAREAAAGVK
jgi:hypothetical protein